MTTKQLIQRLSEINDDLDISIEVNLRDICLGKRDIGDGMTFELTSWTSCLQEKDVTVIKEGERGCQLVLKARVGFGE
jgi:hypothetical protein